MSRFLRRGFTLAEMLIVIAVIGVLSSMMMVASSESVKTSKAGNIIATLQNFASAAMTFYTDSMDHFTKTPNDPSNLKTYVMKYMYNGGNSVQDKDSYTVLNHWDSTNKISTWWVGYNVGNDSDKDSLQQRLANRADSANLKGSTSFNDFPDKTASTKYNGENIVWLLIRTNGK